MTLEKLRSELSDFAKDVGQLQECLAQEQQLPATAWRAFGRLQKLRQDFDTMAYHLVMATDNPPLFERPSAA